MLLSVDLHGLERVTEYHDREVLIASRLENALADYIQAAELLRGENLDILNQQLSFIHEELQQIRKRKKLLLVTRDIISEAKNTFSDKSAEAMNLFSN